MSKIRKETAGDSIRHRKNSLGWSEMPSEILSSIGKRLENRLSATKFRSTCKNWRASLPLPKTPNFLTPNFPRQIPNPISLPFNKQGFHTLDLVPNSVFLVQQIESNSNPPNSIGNCWIINVEESRPGKLRLLYPLSREPISRMPKSFNLSDFKVVEIGKGYSFKSFDRSISDCKVVVRSDCVDQLFSISSNVAPDFTAIVLYSMGDLFGMTTKNGVWDFKRVNSVLWFKDVICFKGVFYAVVGGGKMYVIDHVAFKLNETIVGDFVCDSNCSIKLVESSGELLLVVKDEFKVYRLDEMQHKWEAVQSLGDRIMFLGDDCSFLVSTEVLLRHKGNFVVSSSSMNCSKATSIGLTENCLIYVLCLDVATKKKLKSSYHAFSSILSPPSILFSPSTSPTRRVSEEQGEMQCSGMGSVRSSLSPRSHNQQQNLPIPPPSFSKEFTAEEKIIKSEEPWKFEVPPPLNIIGHSASKEQINSDISLSRRTIQEHNMELDPSTIAVIQTECNATAVELLEEVSSTVIFQGFLVQSQYLPILRKVWMKHGNIVEGTSVRSHTIISAGMETLAKVIHILQTNSVETLTDDHANFLGSALSDLELMHFKVHWLVPSVQKAMAVHKRLHLEADLAELDRIKATGEEMERNFLAAMAAVKQGIEKDREVILESMQALEPHPIDLDKCLGEGLC